MHRLRLGWLLAPLVAFVGLLAVLTLTNRPTLPAPPAVASGDPGERYPATDATAAILDLREAAAAAPGDPEVRAALGDAYYQRSRESGDAADYVRADRAYDAALAADPESFTALAGKATVALARHRFADGLALARRAHRLAPGVVAPYAAFVDGLIENGRYAAAGRALERMIGLKPNLAAYSRVSYFRELHGDLRGAAEALRLAISAGSGTVEGSAYIRSLRGDFEAMRGRYRAAGLAYREALAIDPGYGGALGGLALLQAGRGEFAAAIEALRTQVGDPPSPDALIELGEVEQAAGRHAAARRHYRQALAIEQDLLAEGAGIDAGITLNEAEHGDPERAVRLGRTAWTSAPSVSSADAYAWALYRADRIGAASRLSAEAMRLGSRDPEFLYHAGMIARARGDRTRAARLLVRLLEQSPRFSALYAPRAREALRTMRGG
jgi:tetratricopeptide (TPR) repeat protein